MEMYSQNKSKPIITRMLGFKRQHQKCNSEMDIGIEHNEIDKKHIRIMLCDRCLKCCNETGFIIGFKE
jgi:hypothetical protein